MERSLEMWVMKFDQNLDNIVQSFVLVDVQVAVLSKSMPPGGLNRYCDSVDFFLIGGFGDLGTVFIPQNRYCLH